MNDTLRQLKFMIGMPNGLLIERTLSEMFDISLKSGNAALSGFPLYQYTGVEDRNGKPIYEGHIVKFANPRHYTERDLETVVFDKGVFYAGMHGGSSTTIKPKPLQGKRLEIVGHVFNMTEEDDAKE